MMQKCKQKTIAVISIYNFYDGNFGRRKDNYGAQSPDHASQCMVGEDAVQGICPGGREEER